MNTSLSVVERNHNGRTIRQRQTDRYVDASSMCAAYNRRWRDYSRTDGAKAFASALAERLSELGQNPASLIQTREGKGGYVFVHPQIGIHLAQWLDPVFAVLVSEWMEELLTTGRVEVKPSNAMTLVPYSNRVMHAFLMAGHIPDGYWTIFDEASRLLIDAEAAYLAADLPMDSLDLLDGSVGSHWAKFRKGQSWTGDRVPYQHCFPDGDPRGRQEAWAYPLAELPYFHPWLRKTYIATHFADYLRRKFGACKLIAAVPALRARGISIRLPLSLRDDDA